MPSLPCHCAGILCRLKSFLFCHLFLSEHSADLSWTFSWLHYGRGWYLNQPARPDHILHIFLPFLFSFYKIFKGYSPEIPNFRSYLPSVNWDSSLPLRMTPRLPVTFCHSCFRRCDRIVVRRFSITALMRGPATHGLAEGRPVPKYRARRPLANEG